MIRDILVVLGDLIKALEKLNLTKRYWLRDNRKAIKEFDDIINNLKSSWLKLDEFYSIYVEGVSDEQISV